MSTPTINGDKASSQFISHLTSYPVVSFSIDTFKSNPYGAKSISIADQSYQTLVSPLLPYAQKPYTYLSPYVAKADTLADTGLSKVDVTFPIVREEPAAIKSTVLNYVGLPFKVAGEGRQYVQGTWEKEFKKCGGRGYVDGGKAVITTSLVVASDGLQWLSGYLSKAKGAAVDVAKEKSPN